jgi:hypothetical protein
MIDGTTNLAEITRHRLLKKSNHTVVILENHSRLLDEVIALRQERDALLSASRVVDIAVAIM